MCRGCVASSWREQTSPRTMYAALRSYAAKIGACRYYFDDDDEIVMVVYIQKKNCLSIKYYMLIHVNVLYLFVVDGIIFCFTPRCLLNNEGYHKHNYLKANTSNQSVLLQFSSRNPFKN